MVNTHPLKIYRETQKPKLSQAGLAERLGVARLTVLRWETGERKIDRSLVSEVSKATGISPMELRPDLGDELEELRRLIEGAQ